MATLQKIRNRAGILIAVVIGMALLAFVMGDLFSSGQSMFSRSRTELAEINGRNISIMDFQQRVENLAEIYRLRMGQSALDQSTMENIREQTWNTLVREYVTSSEYKALGLGVSEDETFDMVQGINPHPIVRNLFTDPETGQFNRSFLFQFLRTMDQDPTGQQKAYWLFLEKEIINDRAFTKYTNLIRKGLNVTSLEAGKRAGISNQRVDFSYLVIPYSELADTAVEFSQSDLREYYREHKNEYAQEASRDIEYVIWEVLPSEEDDRNAKQWIENIKDEFKSSDEPGQFVNMNSDVPYDDMNHTYGDLSGEIKDFMFNEATAEDVYGPYFEENAYKLARLVEINYLPDSVRARHILIQPNQQLSMEEAREIADSLKTAIDNGAGFARLARENSMDGSAGDGGDLGWFTEGTMVKSFSDTCFHSAVGEVQIVESRFGVHIVEVLEKSRDVKKIKVAVLVRKVEPSSETYQKIYSRAIRFAGENDTYDKFIEAVENNDLVSRSANGLTEFQKNITGLESPRELIRWAFSAEKHEISPIFEFGDNFVVAALTEVREEGYADFEQVREEIEANVIREKKAEKLAARINRHLSPAESLDELAGKLGRRVQEASDISFSSVSFSGGGIEPEVVAAATALEPELISQPVKGNNGVYVISVNQVDAPETDNIEATRNRLSILRQSRAGYEAFEALKEISGIEDNRARFY